MDAIARTEAADAGDTQQPAAEAAEKQPDNETFAAEPEPESDTDVQPQRTDIISRLPLDEILFIIRALETHLSGGNLSKGANSDIIADCCD